MFFPFFQSRFFGRSGALIRFSLGIAVAVWTLTGVFNPDFLRAQEKTSVFKGKTLGHHAVSAQKDQAPAVSGTDSVPLRFRRVYVPQELLPEIPTFGKNYWPVPEKEFNVWLNENSVSEKGAVLLPKALYAEKAVYRASLADNKYFTGTAVFQIRKIPEEAMISKTPGNPDVLLWSFPPVSFALNEQLKVRQTESEMFTRRDFNFLPGGGGEAVLFSEDFSSKDSQEAACSAEMEWSQRFVKGENGDLRLNLEWIPATDTQWIFELPPEWVPETPDGLVVLERSAETTPEAGAETEVNDEKEENVWRISFGGRRKAALTFRSQTKPRLQETPISCTQKNIYQFRKDGVDVFARMNLTPLLKSFRQSLKPVHELNVQLEGNLVPISVRFNETELEWHSRQENDGLFLTVQLPEAFPETENQLEISAIANLEPWLTWSGNSLRDLPGIHLVNVPRLECRTQVVFFSPLEIRDFTLQNAYLISNRQLPNTQHVQMEFMETSPPAKLQLALARQKNPLMIDLTTAMDFQEHEISAVTEMQVSVKTGESFDILGLVDRSWTIDSVEVTEISPDGTQGKQASGNLLEDWNVDVAPDLVRQTLSDLDPTGELSGKLVADGWDVESFGILHIQLTHSIRPKHPVFVQIRARRLGYSNNYSLTGIQLAPIYFPAYQIGQSWILCGSSTGWNIKFLEPYREHDIQLDVPPKSDPVRLPLLDQETLVLPGEPEPKTETEVKPDTEAKPEIEVKPETEIKEEEGLKPETEGKPEAETKQETSVKPEDPMKPIIVPRSSEPKKQESFSSVLFPTLADARKQFPEQMSFKTGVQDFKNVPMLRLEHSAREFSAEVNGFYDITSTPNAVFSIKCDPQGTEVSRLHLMIRPGILTGINWKFPRNLGGTETRCIERSAPEEVEDLNTTYELWEITFPQPVHDPFVFQLALLVLPSSSHPLNNEKMVSTEPTMEPKTNGPLNQGLMADFSGKSSAEREVWWRNFFPNGLNLPLIDVTDAVNCTGSITLQNDVTDAVLVETQEMIPSILSQKETSGILFKTASEDCGMYRYSPHAISNTPRPQLKLQWRNQNIGVQKAWVWKEFCQSQFFTNGTILRSVSFKIENIDAQQLELSILSPYKTPVEFLGIFVNDAQIPFETLVKPDSKVPEGKAREDTEDALSSLESKSKGIRAVASSVKDGEFHLVIPFPVWQRENEVIVQWLEHQPAWSVFATLNPPQISTNLLVLQKSWETWIPENFVPFGKNDVSWKIDSKDIASDEETTGAKVDTPNVSQKRDFQKDSLLVRLFGPFRLGKNIFSRPENLTLTEIESPIPLDPRSLEKLSSFGPEEKSGGHSSNLAILSRERVSHTVVGWNAFTQSTERPIFVIYGNIVEALRWFLLLFVGFLASRVLAPYRLLRVWLCCLSGIFCMLVPMAWTPIFSGIFLGFGVSFINSSLRRHFRYVSGNMKPVISVKSPPAPTPASKSSKSLNYSFATKTTEVLEESAIFLIEGTGSGLDPSTGNSREKEEKS
ncbi:MAG: hypothetical protein IJU53_01645 [Thermoguttaceae bacterium]|nr:hypothetical protein [Thermoguttaceae bacterium]